MFWILAALALCYWLLRPHKYWARKGVKGSSPPFIMGDIWRIFFKKETMIESFQSIYDKFPNTRYTGFYQFTAPTLMIKDPDLIKQITVKDFDHFLNHKSFFPEDSDPVWSNNLFSLTGKKWRDMRATLSPTFTSSKMKYMFSLITQNGEQFTNYFLEKKEDTITIEMKDAFRRFTNDVIANTAFGIECDSLGDRNNEFFLMGEEVSNFGTIRTLKFMAIFAAPEFCKYFKISPFSEKMTAFFSKVIEENIESREKHGIVRPDMIHLLLQTRKNNTSVEQYDGTSRRGLTNEEITGQAVVFFIAGFDGVATLMSFMSYELATNPDVQQKLIQEVDGVIGTNEGKLTYEALVGMKYMDMVVSETLRKWPFAIQIDRVCTKDYKIEPKCPGEGPVYLKKNDLISMPVFGIHRDPQYYPDPERFDPERFSDENKQKMNPYTYLPFGSGPRICIGNRFALLETKILFFHLLAHFEIVPVEKTPIPLVISKKQINMTAEGGFWCGLRRRKKD